MTYAPLHDGCAGGNCAACMREVAESAYRAVSGRIVPPEEAETGGDSLDRTKAWLTLVRVRAALGIGRTAGEEEILGVLGRLQAPFECVMCARDAVRDSPERPLCADCKARGR